MTETRTSPGQLRVGGRDGRTTRFMGATLLSVGAHIAALGIFSHIPALPDPPPPDAISIDLVAPEPSAGSLLAAAAEAAVLGAPGQPGSEPDPAVPPAPTPQESTAAEEVPGPDAAAVAALEEARTVLEGEVESLTAERAELQARLAAERAELTRRLTSERERAEQLERQLRETEQAREAEVAAVRGTYQRLVHALHGEIAAKEAALREASDRLTVSIVDRVLFPSGQATLTPEGRRVIGKVSKVLADADDQRVLIEGHTDNVPISPRLRDRFPSNWELSTARAVEVVKHLVDRGVPARNLSAAGRADTDPVASNDAEAGRQRNRRIEIILLPGDDRPEAPAGSSPAAILAP